MPTMQEMIKQQEIQKKYQEEQARRAELEARQKRQQTLSTPAKLYGNANMYDKASNWLASSPNQTISNIGTKMSQYSPVRMGKQAIGDMVNKVTGGIQSKLPMLGSGNIGAIGSAADSSIGGLGSIGGGAGIFAPEAGTMAGTLGTGEGAGALSGAIGANVAGTAGTAGAEGLGAIGGAAGSSIGGASAGAGAGAGALAGGAGAALGAVAAPLAIAAMVGSMIHQKNVEKANKEAQIGQKINQEEDAKTTNQAMQNIANTPAQTQQKLMDTANQALAQTQQPQLPTDIAGMQQYMRDNNYSDEAINGLTQGLNYGDPTIDNWIKGYNEQNPNAMINIPQGDEQIALAKEGKFNAPKEEGIADKVSGIMGQLKQGFNEGATDTGLNKLGMVGGKVYDVLSNPAVQGAIAGLAYAKDSGDKLYGLRKGIEWAGNKSTSDYYDRALGRRPGILPGLGVADYKAHNDALYHNGMLDINAQRAADYGRNIDSQIEQRIAKLGLDSQALAHKIANDNERLKIMSGHLGVSQQKLKAYLENLKKQGNRGGITQQDIFRAEVGAIPYEKGSDEYKSAISDLIAKYTYAGDDDDYGLADESDAYITPIDPKKYY